MSMALAYLLRKSVNIQNIRGKRGNKGGGLGHQHLTGVRSHSLNALQLKTLKQLIPGAKVEGDFLKSKAVIWKPGQGVIKRKEYVADCQTPGSVHLIS